jgi:DNA end-binding protein Ku
MRSMWKGVIRFGMVAIPVRMYLATESKDVSFHLLCPQCKGPIRNKRWCPHEDREVSWSEVVRGYEVGQDEYVEISDEDLEKLPTSSTQTVELLSFCAGTEINDLYLQRGYYLEPEKMGVRAYSLLRDALEMTSCVGLGKVAFRDREHLIRIASHGAGLVLHTLHWPDEIRAQAELDLPERSANGQGREMDMAVILIHNLTEPFDPTKFTDEYRTALEALVQEKVETGTVARQPAATPLQTMDLMAALKASIEESRHSIWVRKPGRRARRRQP